jgi:hypothetical protein
MLGPRSHLKGAEIVFAVPNGMANYQGWPELYVYTVYDRVFEEIPAKNTACVPYIVLEVAPVINSPPCQPISLT